jgi:hypothetical protein
MQVATNVTRAADTQSTMDSMMVFAGYGGTEGESDEVKKESGENRTNYDTGVLSQADRATVLKSLSLRSEDTPVSVSTSVYTVLCVY